MNIVNFIILCIFGLCLLFLYRMLSKSQKQTIPRERRAYGEVIETVRGFWLVQFTDENGETVLGQDDTPCESSFHPEKHHLPRKNDKLEVFYWIPEKPLHLSWNLISVKYRIHFCDETLYDTSKQKTKRFQYVLLAGSVLLFLLAVFCLFK